MKMNMRLTVELVLVAAFASIAFTNAATYTVGGTGARWIPTTNGYGGWASSVNFTVGDILVFDFATGAHDVATVTKANYDDCDDDLPIALITTGPASITLNTSGMNYFICTIGEHCEGGQKLAVNVMPLTSGPTPPATPSPPGATSPPPPSTTGSTSPPPPSTTGSTSPPPPPAGNSATALAGGSFFAGLIGTVVMGMMMV